MRAKTKCLIWAVVISIFEFLPFPTFGLVLLYVAVHRPPWFRSLVERLYREP